MINHKYHSLLGICIAGILLAIFAPRKMRDYYPTVFCGIAAAERYHPYEIVRPNFHRPYADLYPDGNVTTSGSAEPKVQYYCFAKHTWILKQESQIAAANARLEFESSKAEEENVQISV
jgi:hypothetical protein